MFTSSHNPLRKSVFRVTANGVEIDAHDNFHRTYEDALDYWRDSLSHLPNTTYGITRTIKEIWIEKLET